MNIRISRVVNAQCFPRSIRISTNMVLSTTSHQFISLLLLATPTLSTHSYTPQIQLSSDGTHGISQHCIHLPPGICCRRLNLPDASTRFQTFDSASFLNMQPRDLALVWTPDRPAPGYAGHVAGDPLPSAAGCGGRVLTLKMIDPDSRYWVYGTERDPITGAWPKTITGASYVAMPPESGTGYDGITGMRAVLGGGGKMFGAKNRTGISVYPYHMVSRRDTVVDDVGDRTQWVWPDQVTL